MYKISKIGYGDMPSVLETTKMRARIRACWVTGVWDWKLLYKQGFRAVKI